MSIEAITWALNTAPIPTGRNASTLAFVLVGLANHADPDGHNAFPAVATLVRYTRLSERSVRNILRELTTLGLIRPSDPDIVAAYISRADRRPNGYDLDLSLSNVDNSARPVDNSDGGGRRGNRIYVATQQTGNYTVEPVSLDALVRAALGRLSPVDVAARLRPTVVHGDPVLLDLLVDNVIRNAVRHNVPAGSIWLTTGDRELVVENTGAVVSTARLAELVEPFRRGTQDRVGTGAGLGLAIVTTVARAHRAEVSLTPREAGGIRVAVRFP